MRCLESCPESCKGAGKEVVSDVAGLANGPRILLELVLVIEVQLDAAFSLRSMRVFSRNGEA